MCMAVSWDCLRHGAVRTVVGNLCILYSRTSFVFVG
jgi:hypothetical protein